MAYLPQKHSSTNAMVSVLESYPSNESLIFRTLMYYLKMDNILIPWKHPGQRQSRGGSRGDHQDLVQKPELWHRRDETDVNTRDPTSQETDLFIRQLIMFGWQWKMCFFCTGRRVSAHHLRCPLYRPKNLSDMKQEQVEMGRDSGASLCPFTAELHGPTRIFPHPVPHPHGRIPTLAFSDFQAEFLHFC